MGTSRADTRAMARQIGERLHHYFENLVQAPLPERWVALINRLNSEEARVVLPKRDPMYGPAVRRKRFRRVGG